MHWTLVEDLRHLKWWKIPIQLGRTKDRKKERGNGKGSAPLAGSWRRGEVPTFREAPSWWGKQVGQRRSFRRSEGNATTSLWKARQSKICTHGLCWSPANPSVSPRVSTGVEWGWVLGSGVWRADPGTGQLLAVKRQPEGTGVRSSTTGNVCRKSLDHHRGKEPLVSDVQGLGPQL